jgi:hypothetical protein
MTRFLSLLFLALLSAPAGATVQNCTANGQFANGKQEAIELCSSQTSMSPQKCAAQVKCFGPVSYCVAGATAGESLESVIAQCSRTQAAADCESQLKCFSNVSSCTANGEKGSSAAEAVDYCALRTKMNRSQCLQSLHCEEEKYPMPPRPTVTPTNGKSVNSHENSIR